MKVLAAVVGLAGMVCLWMLITVDLVASSELDVANLLLMFNTPNIALGLWVLCTAVSVGIRAR